MTAMEDVLAAHQIQICADAGGPWSPPEEDCTCSCGDEIGGWVACGPDWEYPDWTKDHAAHVAQALTAAGFGNLHDAWAEGRKSLMADLAGTPRYGTPGYKETPNPYRTQL